jgi:maltoporin
MDTIINAIPEYVITAVVSTVFYFAVKYAQTLIHAKMAHAKTQQSKELWGLIESVADTAVDSMVSADLTGNEKFAKATAIVQSTLDNQGFKNVDIKSIHAAVQSAYEKSPLTPTVIEGGQNNDTTSNGN